MFDECNLFEIRRLVDEHEGASERSVIIKSEKCIVLSVMIKGGSTRRDEICTRPVLAECCTELHMQIGAMKSSFRSTLKD